MDIIHIRRLEIFANHGVIPEENTLGQKFIISADLYKDLRRAGKTDDVNETVHYGQAAVLIKQISEKSVFKLIEKLGGKVNKAVFLMELAGLQGREKLKGYDVESVLCYDGK